MGFDCYRDKAEVYKKETVVSEENEDIYKCESPCPKCGSTVSVYGSKCYPEEGVIIECDNIKCLYMVEVKITSISDKTFEFAKNIHEQLYKSNKGEI